MDRFDGLAWAGALLVAIGAGMIYVPAGLIVLGLALVVYGVIGAAVKARSGS